MKTFFNAAHSHFNIQQGTTSSVIIDQLLNGTVQVLPAHLQKLGFRISTSSHNRSEGLENSRTFLIPNLQCSGVDVILKKTAMKILCDLHM